MRGMMNDDRYSSGESGYMDIIRGLLPHGGCEKEYWLPTGLVKRIFYKGGYSGVRIRTRGWLCDSSITHYGFVAN